MFKRPSSGLPLAILLLAAAGVAAAQTQVPASVTTASRLAGDWRSAVAAVLPNSGPAQLRIATDLGSAPSSTSLQRMLLLLAPSAAQQQALTAKLADLQNPSSSSYHQWLTPAQYAASYANSASDVVAVVAWLQSEGFTVAALPAGRGWIEFSGTAAQVEQAFQTHVHLASASGSTRPYLTSTISVPSAIAPLVQGLVSVDGVLAASALTTPQTLTVTAADLSTRTSASTAEALTPKLVAGLIHFDTLQASGITGTGQSIAIPSRSNVNTADIAAFRSAFDLPAQTLMVILNGTDPGLADDQAEATLAASWAGAAAPSAQILLAPAAATAATDGFDLALAGIVDGALANTIEVGYNSCEAGMSTAHQAFYAALYQQAAAEGIAIVAATGDSGASACYQAGSTTAVSTGYAANALAATPWNTAVGVAAYTSAGPSAGTAALTAWAPVNSGDPAYAGGGGSSTLYTAPSWQAKTPQIAAGTMQNRLLPDFALPTAIDSSANRGLAFCLSSSASSNGCTLVRSGGSSAAASIFAGVAALLASQHGAQGSLQTNIYALSSTSGVYADVQQGSASLSCTSGTTDCSATGQIGYSATAGYDLATGLGAVNAAALVNNWVSPMVGTAGTNISLSVSPVQTNSTYNPSASIIFTASVLSASSGVTPTGTVVFYDTSTSQSLSLPITLDSTGSGSATLEGVFALGGNEMVIDYSGDATYASATSSTPLNINTQASTTSLVVTPSTTAAAPGQNISVVVTLTVGTPAAGTVNPSGVVTLNVDGGQQTYTASTTTTGGVTTATFATVLMPANSTLTTHTLQAVYPTNADYAGSTSPQITINITKTTPTVTLTPATSSPLPGASLLLTSSITPTVSESLVPSGTVNFYENGTLVGTTTVTAGSPSSTATLTITAPTTGTATLYAVYNGDSNYTTATSATTSITVTKITPTLTLTPATTTPTGGSTLLLTATLAQTNSVGAVPTGIITFLVDGIATGTATLVSGTTATYTITVPTSGSHTIQATYPGDTNFAAASSAVSTLTVSKLVTTVVVTPSTTTPAAGASVTFTATITPTSYSSSGDPSGSVTYLLDGITTLGTSTVTAGTPSTATFSTTSLTSGSHTILATYSGDTYYATSSAYSSTITVSKTTTTTSVIPATTTPSAGSMLQVTAYVYPSATLGTLPSGTVTFTLDGVSVGTATLTSGSPSTATLTFTVGSAGTHTLSATYAGDTYYSSSTATAVTLNTTKSTPTVVVTPATTTPSAGSTLQLTATITPPSSSGTSATGTVSFLVDGTVVGTTSVVSGSPSTATLTVTTPSIGSHTVQATYNGDTNYYSATSAAVGIIVNKATTTLTVTPATTTPIANSSMLVTATLASSSTSSITATGTVTFTLDGSTVATSTLGGGTTATATITVPSTGTHAIQAIYSGDTNYYASTANPVNITVAKTTTTTVVTPSTTTPSLGSTLPITVTVTPSAVNTSLPTGTVTISVDGVATQAQTITSGNPSTAAATLAAMTPGTHTIAAAYSGDTYYSSSSSASVTVTVPKVTTSTIVTPATTTPSGGASLSVSATITPATTQSTLPSGTVNFTLDGTSVSSVAVVSGSPATASTTLTSTSLTPGTHALAAVYSGDTVYGASTSSAVTLTVSKSPTTTTIIPSTLTPTAGGSMTVVVDVTSSSPATAMPSGTVTLTEDGVAVGSATLTSGSPSAGTVTLNVVSAGTHVLAATYSGDTYYTASNSSTVSIIAAKGATTTTVTATPAALTAGTAESLTAVVAPAVSTTGVTYTLTGTVSFYDGTTLLGTATVSSNTATLAGLSLKDNVNHTITAVYSGDTNWFASTSTTLPLDATTLPDYVVLTSNYTTAPPGVAVILTATVTPTSSSTTSTETNPSGTVVFYDGTTVIGQATLSAVSSLSTSSVATLTTQTLPGGADTIYAFYEGDSYFDAATSNLLTLTVEDFTITPSSSNPATNLTIVKGSSGSAAYVIAGEGGFNNEVQVVCAVSTQDDMTCTASPQQVVPTGTVTFVVQTFKSGTTISHLAPPSFWPKTVGGTALAAVGLLFLPFGRRVRRRLLARAGRTAERGLILLLMLVGLFGTGVGCTSSTAVISTGTPLGVATLKITASSYVDNAVVSHSVYLTVNVVTSD